MLVKCLIPSYIDTYSLTRLHDPCFHRITSSLAVRQIISYLNQSAVLPKCSEPDSDKLPLWSMIITPSETDLGFCEILPEEVRIIAGNSPNKMDGKSKNHGDFRTSIFRNKKHNLFREAFENTSKGKLLIVCLTRLGL